VAYCNDPAHAERRSHGRAEALTVKYWQIGNETSYDPEGFALDEAGRKTAEFARAMKKADSSIRLIGWGGDDHGARGRGRAPENWIRGIAEAAGENLDYLAFHHMYNPDDPSEPALAFLKYRENPARTWDVLMDAWKAHDAKIRDTRDRLGGLRIPLAMTECHFSIPGRNRNEVMSTWACGVAYARLLHVHERHGDVLKIATAADFCGTRWQVNAVMIPVPGGESFLMPVAHVMKLYRRFTGTQAASVVKTPPGLDVTASRAGDRIWLHVANVNRTRPVTARIQVGGAAPRGGAVHEIAADPMLEVHERNHGALEPVTKALPASGIWTFPAASVSAVEIEGVPQV
jgi:alpha-L-arabinofuranosidase